MQTDTESDAGAGFPSRLRLAAFAILGLYGAWGLLYVYRTSFVEAGRRVFLLWDDGMVSMQYARNLAEGHGLVWIPGEEAVQGFSNTLVTLVMALVHALPLPSPPLVMQLVNLALVCAVAWWLFRLVAREWPEHPPLALATLLALVLWGPFAIWSLQGSDTGFVAFWVMGALWLQPREYALRFPPHLLAWLALGLWIRPDAGLAYVMLVAGAWWISPRRIRDLVAPVAVLFVTEAVIVAFSQLYYGEPLPNTYYLKATGAVRADVWASAWEQGLRWWPWVAALLALAGWGSFVGRDRRLVVQSAGLLAATLAYDVWTGGDWLSQYASRFVTPVFPLAILLACVGVHDCVGRLPARWPGQLRVGAGAAVLVFAVLLANPPEARREWFGVSPDTMTKSFNRRNYQRGAYLARFSDEDTRIAVHWAGISPYVSRRPALDLLGKTDRHIAHLPVVKFEPGHSKWDWDYALAKRPDVFVSVSRGLQTRGDFLDRYYLLRSPALGRGQLPLYVRKTSAGKIRDPDAAFLDARTRRPVQPRPR